ncbi:MAG: glycoside hydrolase family 38 N-terminal domain-containing protein [Candidatus Thorarchaeota archaeon]
MEWLAMGNRWIVNLCPFLHFDNSRTQTYEHNISIVSWNVKSVLDFLDVHADHKFCLDQVTLFEGFGRLFPNYLDTLHERVLEGRIEVVGGTYVMPDFLIPDGESIVRQFLLGNKFFREEYRSCESVEFNFPGHEDGDTYSKRVH